MFGRDVDLVEKTAIRIDSAATRSSRMPRCSMPRG